MALFYSDFFSATGVFTSTATVATAPATADGPRYMPNVQRVRGTRRTLTAYAKCLPQTTDFVVLLNLPSNTRIAGIWMNDDNASSAGTMNLGLYKAGTTTAAVTGAGTMFASALARNTNHTEAFTQAAGNIKAPHRFAQVWELLNIVVASTFTADPNTSYDLIMVPAANFTVAASQFLVEVDIMMD
jgi:hypothetical protein